MGLRGHACNTGGSQCQAYSACSVNAERDGEEGDQEEWEESMVALLTCSKGRAVRDGACWTGGSGELPWQEVGATNVLTPLSSHPPTGRQSQSSECSADTSPPGTGVGTAGRRVNLGMVGAGDTRWNAPTFSSL